MTTTDSIRADQIAEARRLAEQDTEVARPTLRLPPGADRRPTAPGSRTGAGAQAKKTLKGHEAFLKALEMNDARIEVEKCDGTIYRGVLRHTDKFTLTVNVTEVGSVDGASFIAIEGRDRVIFKHDISEFSALTARKVEAQ
jgi:sRNA-binding regulator protein Hfq